MGIELSVLAGWLGTAVLMGGAAVGGTMALSGGDKKDKAPEANKTQDIGNLSQEEVDGAAAKKAYRAGSFFTSSTGLNQGSRGRSRLMGG